MHWYILAIILLIFTTDNPSEAKMRDKNLPSAVVVVVGTVYCDTCFQSDYSKPSHFISGALVAVECGGTNSRPSFREEVKTNDHGKFKVHLPFSVSKHVKKIKGCSVKLISSNEPYCAVASTAKSDISLHLKSRKKGIHIFSAGFFTFKPLKQPTLCYQRPSLHNSREFNSKKPSNPSLVDRKFPSVSIQDPTPPMPLSPPPPPLYQFIMPPLPELPKLPPLPQLPPLPPLPGLPSFPPPGKNSMQSKANDPLETLKLSNGKAVQQQLFGPLPQIPIFPSPPPAAVGIVLPPNPLQPPSILPLPPNPFQLPPLTLQTPPLTLPPNPLQTLPLSFPPNPFQPLPPVTSFPPLRGLTPPPPPPPPLRPPPAAALPPFPFQPSPGFPGIPPVKETSP